jgi:hypothetical protein
MASCQDFWWHVRESAAWFESTNSSCLDSSRLFLHPTHLSLIIVIMSARRQPSTTSLSKYYGRATSPGLQNRSLDFCNAFWGIGDGGVDVLFARMRGATRTMEELKNFWKER